MHIQQTSYIKYGHFKNYLPDHLIVKKFKIIFAENDLNVQYTIFCQQLSSCTEGKYRSKSGIGFLCERNQSFAAVFGALVLQTLCFVVLPKNNKLQSCLQPRQRWQRWRVFFRGGILYKWENSPKSEQNYCNNQA